MDSTTSFMYQVKEHLYKRRYFYFVLASVIAVYIIPLILAYLPKGHDIPFHITRLGGLAEEIKLGNFPARLYSTIFNNYGYASPLFYGDWLLYIPALLVVCGFKVYTAYKFFIMFCIVLAALSMYFSAQIMFKDKKAACVAALIYSLSTYLGTDALVRHAIGELQSFIFIPIAIAGLYDIIFHDAKRWLLLPLGLCGVIISHTLTSVLTVLFLSVFALICISRFFEKPKKLLYIIASAGVFILLAASFIFPMIEQLESTKFLATDGFSANAYGSLELRSMPNVYSLFSVLNEAVKVGEKSYFIPQGVGLALPVMIGWYVTYRDKVLSIEGIAFLLLALLALFMTSRLFPWESLQDEFGTLQFPWRIMLFATVFISLFGGVIVKKLAGTSTLSILITIILVVSFYSVDSTILWKYKSVYFPTKKDYNVYNYVNQVGLGEYLPTGSNAKKLKSRGDIITSNSYISEYNINRDGDLLVVEFNDITKYNGNKNDETYIDLPLIMYKGYKATLESDKVITELTLTYGENNVVRIYIGDIDSGTIKVWYEGTIIQKVSFIVTLLSFGSVITYFILVYNKRKRNTVTEESPELSILKEEN
ncbi:MAG: hypothetical protein A2Y15_01135 [Clostridiales bacterium GWF2_36_10]|nr:MAG: hypothetical protein A2Y15_01135 [Clostridiales bacterium GWF2_36_10]HAN20139.1 hypothetical protein [Clostridiales bacterium]